MNILVEGSRGKSGTVKMIVDALESLHLDVMGKITGKETVVFFKGDKIQIPRKEGLFLLDKENKELLKRFNTKYKVFENQALSCYTMKVVHKLLNPQIIIIPNIRNEHQDRLGETLEEQTISFAKNFKGARKVITTEQKREVLDIFQEYCDKYDVKLIKLKLTDNLPGIESVLLTKALLKEEFNAKLPKKIEKEFLVDLIDKMSIKTSNLLSVKFFIGAKVNDLESTKNVLKYLNEPVCIVAYLRKDRPERTKAFIPFFKQLDNFPNIKKVFIIGYGFESLPKNKKISKLDEDSHAFVIDYCKSKNLTLFTAINGVNPYMKTMENILCF